MFIRLTSLLIAAAYVVLIVAMPVSSVASSELILVYGASVVFLWLCLRSSIRIAKDFGLSAITAQIVIPVVMVIALVLAALVILSPEYLQVDGEVLMVNGRMTKEGVWVSIKDAALVSTAVLVHYGLLTLGKALKPEQTDSSDPAMGSNSNADG